MSIRKSFEFAREVFFTAWARKLLASVTPLRGHIVTEDPATGYGTPAVATTAPNMRCAGVANNDTATAGASNGDASCDLHVRFVHGYQTGTAAGDALLDSDWCAGWVLDKETIGKLSNLSGVNRSIAGFVAGLHPDTKTPFWLPGPIGWMLGRLAVSVDNASAGSVGYPVDSGATVDVGSTSAATAAILMPRAKTHGRITSIEIVPSAALSATSGNDRTITIWKIDTLGVATAVNVGTFTTTTALVAQTRALFTLSAVAGALDMLETDILGYSTVHASSGAVIPQSAIRANMKVQ